MRGNEIENLYKRVENFSLIETKHFVKTQGDIYPLFNTSIVVDIISLIAENEDRSDSFIRGFDFWSSYLKRGSCFLHMI